MWTKPGYTPEQSTQQQAPADTGERLATFPRGKADELRVSIGEFNGKRFVNLRLWSRGNDGQWWPTPKGATVRAREIDDTIAALEKARDLLAREDKPQANGRNSR